MRKFVNVALFLVALFVLIPTYVKAEEVESFSVLYDVLPTGIVAVTETITYDFDNDFRHGIFRTLGTAHPQSATAWYKERSVDINDVAVMKNGEPEPFSETLSDDMVKIKIGRPDITITGVHVYTLNYKLVGALSYGTDGVEFYWNATGNAWQVPIVNSKVTVRDISGLLFASSSACYKGTYGSNAPCPGELVSPTEHVYTSVNLKTGEGMTVAQSLHADSLDLLIYEHISVALFIYIAAILCVCCVLIWSYIIRTKYKVAGTVVVQYEPYNSLLPVCTGVLFDTVLHPRDITAGILYLAERGFVRIRRIEEKDLLLFTVVDYELTLLRPTEHVHEPLERSILKLIFVPNAALGTSVRISQLTTPSTPRFITYEKIKADLFVYLQHEGYLYTARIHPKMVYITFICCIVLVLLGITVSWHVLFAGLFALVASSFIVSRMLSKCRTKKGYEAYNHLLGFKLYLSVTEKERYAFHNAPDKNPELYMRYLPYAIALGVENEWAQVFKDISMPSPDWYQGGDFRAFSIGGFSSSIGTLSAMHSSSSGISGSFGGGYSGGGGGGGGGGSW